MSKKERGTFSEHGITTAIDISDGLAADLAHICDASRLGVQLNADALPVIPEVIIIAKQAARDHQDLALFGGEDYELLFTVPARRAPALAQELFMATGVRTTAIGTLLADGSRTVVRQGKTLPLGSRGWDHLRTESLPEGFLDALKQFEEILQTSPQTDPCQRATPGVTE